MRSALDQAQEEGDIEVLFSAHSIPLSLAATSPYVGHVTETARLCAELAGIKSWRLVWQSRWGRRARPGWGRTCAR